MRNIEFYTVDERVMYIKDGEHHPLDESQKEIINQVAERVELRYPEAHARLLERTKILMHRPNYRKFRMVLRFCKCNFGNADTREMDINEHKSFRFERVQCPLRGECDDEGVICMPKIDNKITSAERRVVDMLRKGYDRKKIARELCLSPYTVRNHIYSLFDKLNLQTESQLIKYIIEEERD